MRHRLKQINLGAIIYSLLINEEDDQPWVAPIELTESKADFSKFWRQLNAGAAIADRLLPKQVMAVRFRPVAVHNGIHRNDVRKISRISATRFDFET